MQGGIGHKKVCRGRGRGRGRGSELGAAESPRERQWVQAASTPGLRVQAGWGGSMSEGYHFETINVHNVHMTWVQGLRSPSRKDTKSQLESQEDSASEDTQGPTVGAARMVGGEQCQRKAPQQLPTPTPAPKPGQACPFLDPWTPNSLPVPQFPQLSSLNWGQD